MGWFERQAEREHKSRGGALAGAVGPLGGKRVHEPAGAHPEAARVARREPSPSPGPVPGAPSRLYVATDLDTWETATPEPDQDAICERCGYRRLDPEYYAWLRGRMEVAKGARRRGRLPAAQYEELRRRFNAVHGWAVEHLGEEALLAAVRGLDVEGYRPPAIQDDDSDAAVARARAAVPAPESPPTHLHPADGDWPFSEPVTPEALAKVDAIREQALALGWSEAALYQNRGRLRFPVGGDYGLVCFVGGRAQIGEVSAESIEIVMPSGSRLRYRRQAAGARALR